MVKMKFTILQDQGARPYMEDTFMTGYAAGSTHAIFGVFDGHGGSQVAEYCARKFKECFLNIVESTKITVQCIEHAFTMIDTEAEEIFGRAAHIGSTAIVGIIDCNDNIWMANCGDSLGMLVHADGTHTMLSVEHKVENEKTRLAQQGAIITYDDGVARLFKTLNVSRGIGDYFMRPYFTSTPCIMHTTLSQNDKYVVVASDGIWDVFTASELSNLVMGIIHQELVPASDAVRIIHNEARRRGSGDNITLMLIDLQQ